MDQTVEAEFTEFVAARGPVLLRAAYALTGDEHAAHDLVQGALAKAFTRWRHIRTGPEQYVRRIIYNSHVSAWRRVRRREISVADPPERPAADAVDTSTALRLALRDALQTLPPRQRAIVVLRFLEDMSVEETARILGCRVGTVGSQTTRALAKLRALIKGLDLEVVR
jgi:RNA polymerase sigma-70 factor (sigma-E family)